MRRQEPILGAFLPDRLFITVDVPRVEHLFSLFGAKPTFFRWSARPALVRAEYRVDKHVPQAARVVHNPDDRLSD